MENYGTIGRLELVSNIIESAVNAGSSDLSFIAKKNFGLIEDIHIKAESRINSRHKAVHAVAQNRSGGTVQRIYNEGRVFVSSGELPATASLSEVDYLDGATNTVGYSYGSVSQIAYKFIPRWSFNSQYGFPSYTALSANECQFDGSGGMPPVWETAMSSPTLFNRFGLMVSDIAPTYLFTRPAFFTPGFDTFYLYDNAACSFGAGNPTVYFVPFDQQGGTGLISQAQSQMYSTFSTWDGISDVTGDDMPTHQYRYEKILGLNPTRPVWLFDTTNSLRFFR